MSITVESLEVQIQSDASAAIGGLEALASTLGKLKAATQGGVGLSAVATQIRGLSEAAKTLNGSKVAVLQKLVTSCKGLSSIGDSKFGKVAEDLKRFPSVLKQLEKINTDSFAAKIRNLAQALEPLSRLNLPQLSMNVDKLSVSLNKKPSSSSDGALGRLINLTALVATLKTVWGKVSKSIQLSNQYVEDLNLFTASMGEHAREAQRYGETVSEVMGIDPSVWLRNQGVFMTITEGFGVASDRAYIMSKNLTQLGYDISSFYNINVEDAFKKLSSGISGELEPLRRLGYDLSVARLQQEALNLGINKSVNAMTQAEKAELRYYAIMSQVTVAQGDMARTLDAPANQLRIFTAQLTQCARAVGNIFIPALNAVLPMAIAFAKAIRYIANAIASLFGFKLPEIDYSGLSKGVSGVGGAADNASKGLGKAAKKAKELKNALLGIDELNIISKPDPTSGGGSGSGDPLASGGGLGFDLPQYDFLGDAVSSKVNRIFESLRPTIEWVEEHLKGVLDLVKAVAIALLTWKIGSKIVKILGDSTLKEIVNTTFGKYQKAIGITLIVTGVTLMADGAYDIGYEGLNVYNMLRTAIGAAMGIGGSLMTFGLNRTGFLVGIGLTLAVSLIGIIVGKEKSDLEKELKKRFGEIKLGDSEVNALSKKLTTTKLGMKLNVYVDEISNLNSIQEELNAAIETITANNIKIECGIDVSQSDYKASIDKYLDNATKYVEQNRVVTMLAIDVGLDEGETKTRLTEFANSYYSATNGRLAELGSQLKEVVSTGFSKGEWIPNKFEQAVKLNKEIQAILDEQAEMELRAHLNVITFDLEMAGLDAESFKKVIEEAQNEIKEQIEAEKESRLRLLTIAEMNYKLEAKVDPKEAAKTYKEAINEINAQSLKNTTELTLTVQNVGMDDIKNKFAEEVQAITPLFEESVQNMYSQVFGVELPDNAYANVTEICGKLQSAYIRGINDVGMSEQAKNALEGLLDVMKPSTDELENLANTYNKMGLAVPENIAQGLSDVNQLKALSGHTDGIKYLIGEKLSNDPSFFKLLQTSENAGKQIDTAVAAGLKNNAKFVYDEVKGTITVIQSDGSKWVTNASDTLVKNLEDMGINMSEGLANGFEEGYDLQEYTSTVAKIITSCASILEINSPSRVFKRMGAQCMDGLALGFSDTSGIESAVTTLVSKIKKWFTGDSSTGVNTSAFETIGNAVTSAFAKSVGSTSGSSKSSMTTWADDVTTWFTGAAYGAINKNTFNKYGTNSVTGYKSGVTANEKLVRTVMQNTGNTIKSTFLSRVADSKFRPIGKDTVQGFNEGVLSKISSCKDVITSWGSKVTKWLKDKLDIHSPSRVFMETGQLSVIGYNEGVDSLMKTTKVVVDKWVDSFIGEAPVMDFAVDTSALKYYNSDSFTRDISSDVTSNKKYTITGFQEGIEAFYKDYVEPTLTQIAEDMRRQADKNEQTVVQIGNRTINDAVIAQQKNNGYSFAR